MSLLAVLLLSQGSGVTAVPGTGGPKPRRYVLDRPTPVELTVVLPVIRLPRLRGSIEIRQPIPAPVVVAIRLTLPSIATVSAGVGIVNPVVSTTELAALIDSLDEWEDE